MQSRDALEKKFNFARSALLLIAVLSAVNVAFELLGSSIAFTFSASSPLLAVILTRNESGAKNFAGIVIAFLIIAFFLVCWLASKNNPGMMLAALVAFILDSIVLIFLVAVLIRDGSFEISTVVDLLFHALALAGLISGVAAWNKLKKLTIADTNVLPVFFDLSDDNSISPLEVLPPDGQSQLTLDTALNYLPPSLEELQSCQPLPRADAEDGNAEAP